MPHTPAWHAAQAADERAWLDQWARAERAPECPWARPDYNVMADFTGALIAMAAGDTYIPLASGSPR
ncbi:hypothetical protein [Streptomyces sp. NPDC058985]|uniref:hypothetical protein n=1 Tax=Streptomyces sp. NPDC058985 TaxID=3346684 RepID=UPI0036BBC0EB